MPKENNMKMVYIRSKKIKGKTYYYIVEGKLDKKGKVKQKVLMYLEIIVHWDTFACLPSLIGPSTFGFENGLYTVWD